MQRMIRTLALALAFAAPMMIAAPAAHAASQDAGGYRVVQHGGHYQHGPARYRHASYYHNHHRYEHRSVRRVCHHGECRRVVRYW